MTAVRIVALVVLVATIGAAITLILAEAVGHIVEHDEMPGAE